MQYESSTQQSQGSSASNPTNMAVQSSLFDIFSEFTLVITGEIKKAESKQGFNIKA